MTVMAQWRLNRETVARNLDYLDSCQPWREPEVLLVQETLALLVRQIVLAPLAGEAAARNLWDSPEWRKWRFSGHRGTLPALRFPDLCDESPALSSRAFVAHPHRLAYVPPTPEVVHKQQRMGEDFMTMERQQGIGNNEGLTVPVAAGSPLVRYLELIRVWCETAPNPLSERESEDRERVVQSFAQFVAERGYAHLSHVLLEEGGLAALGSDSPPAAIRSRSTETAGSLATAHYPASADTSGLVGAMIEKGGKEMRQQEIRTVPASGSRIFCRAHMLVSKAKRNVWSR